MSFGSVSIEKLDPSQIRSLPKYPIPVLHIGQLAVDSRHQKKGYAQMLLAFALRSALDASKVVGCYAAEIVADNPEALSFYRKYGFQALALEENRLFLILDTYRKSLEG